MNDYSNARVGSGALPSAANDEAESPGLYKYYVLFSLAMMSMAGRALALAPMEPMKQDLGLSDAQSGTNTSGGPRRDEQGRIIHAFGHALPGLFGAGECGLSMGMLRPGVSAYYSEVLCSGRFAGEGAMDGSSS